MSTTGSDIPAPNTLLSASSYNGGASSYRSVSTVDAASSLKRHASSDGDGDERTRKRMKEDTVIVANGKLSEGAHAIDGHALVEDLAQELQCGCCSELVYKPVIVVPCDHFFCGSCCTLWVKNGGTNCPACRSVSTAVMPSRALQSMVDVLLRAAPHRQRMERERMQADDIYPTLRAFRIPMPREPSPEPIIPPSSDFVQPCLHCLPNNSFHWTCPRPIADPATDPDNAWHVNDGTPPGHGFCGNCEVLLALRAPSTSRCDFCQVSFCGINVQGRCAALGITMQSPHGMTDVVDLIQSAEIYDCFEGNTVEVELMLDYLMTQRLSPKHIYRQIAAHIQAQPDGFRPLLEQDLFMDMHSVAGEADPDPSSPRRYICRLCATEMFLYGLRDWWLRERRKAVREGILEGRKDCPGGTSCRFISDPAHAKEFNHLVFPAETEKVPQASTSSSGILSSSSAVNRDVPSSATSTLFLPPISSDLLPTSAATVSSVSNLVSEMALSRPVSTNGISVFSRSGLSPDGRIGVSQTAGVAVLSADSRAPLLGDAREGGSETPIEEDTDDTELAEPSSSQSQRSVEAHLTQKLLAEYDSDVGSDAEDKARDAAEAEADAHLEACYAAATQADVGFSSVRHAQSSSKAGLDVDVSMGDVRPISESAHASFHILPDMGSDPAETTTPLNSSAYSVQVE